MEYYLFNIGNPRLKTESYFNSWWMRHVDDGFITTGYEDKLHLGEKKLRHIGPGNWIIAYANGFGAVGAGIAGEPYFFIENLPAVYETNHRNHLPVHWHHFVDKVSDGVPSKDLRLNTQRVGTRTRLSEDHANYIITLLKEKIQNDLKIYPDEISVNGLLVEGAVKSVLIDNRERNQQARRLCIAYHGFNCSACEMNFQERYGSIGQGFIHVHHLRPISQFNEEYSIDPKKHLRPVCPNCHAMLHRGDPAISIDELRNILGKPPLG